MFLVSGIDSGGCVFNRIVIVVLYCFSPSLFMKVKEFFSSPIIMLKIKF